MLAESESTLDEIGNEARSLNDLKEVMDALLTLERERYYEAINGSAGQNRGGGIMTERLPLPACQRLTVSIIVE